MIKLFSAILVIVVGSLAGCASVDAQDRFVLGEASRANIAAQSIQDVAAPNSKTIQSTSGVRAVKAMKALNEGPAQVLASNGTGGAE